MKAFTTLKSLMSAKSKKLSTSKVTTTSQTPKEEPVFEKFLDLPPEIQANILSKGLPMTSLRPAQQLELAAKTSPLTVLSPDFLLPIRMFTYLTVGYNADVEEKEFKTATEIKEYIANILATKKNLEGFQFYNDYIRVRIAYFKESKEGTININVFSSKGDNKNLAILTLNFIRMKDLYDTIILSKVLLQLYLPENEDLEYLKEIFIGIRWLSFVFKKITWQKDLLQFENPDNIKVYVNKEAYIFGKPVELRNIDSEVIQKALLLLKYIEKSLTPRRRTMRKSIASTRRA